MKFSEVVEALMMGKRIRKKGWSGGTRWHTSNAYFIYDNDHNTFDFYEVLDGEHVRTEKSTTLDLTPRELTSNDWEVVE